MITNYYKPINKRVRKLLVRVWEKISLFSCDYINLKENNIYWGIKYKGRGVRGDAHIYIASE